MNVVPKVQLLFHCILSFEFKSYNEKTVKLVNNLKILTLCIYIRRIFDKNTANVQVHNLNFSQF